MVQDNVPNSHSYNYAEERTRRINAQRAALKRQKRMGRIGCGFLVLVAVGGCSALVVPATINHYKTWDVTFTVSKAERVCDSSGSNGQTCRYLVYTDKGTFEDTDSTWYSKYNSSDVYGQIGAGKTYKAHVYGTRNTFLSWYPNILSVTEVNK